jgi:anti-sigma B factor antagonist
MRRPPVVVTVEGELTIYTAVELRSRLLSALMAAGSLDVDLSAVSEFDGAGLQLLLALDKEARISGKLVRLLMPSLEVMNVLTLCCVTGAFGGGVVTDPLGGI